MTVKAPYLFKRLCTPFSNELSQFEYKILFNVNKIFSISYKNVIL